MSVWWACLAAITSAALAGCGKGESKPAHPKASIAEKLIGEMARLGMQIDGSVLRYEDADRAQALRDITRIQSRWYSPGFLDGRWVLMSAFGIDAGADAEALLQATIDAMPDVLLAYYQDDRDTLVFFDGPLAQLDTEGTVAHELTHAYHDQQQGSLDCAGDIANNDALQACRALIEGAAELTSTAVLLAREGKTLAAIGLTELLDAYLPALHVAPLYGFGAIHMYRRFIVDQWKPSSPGPGKLLASTEQLMHTIKLDDEPTTVSLPPVDEILAGATVNTQTVGELGIYRLLVDLEVRPAVAEIVAAGWDGDRLSAHRTPDGDWGLMWRTLWDREHDAAHFARTLDKVTAKKSLHMVRAQRGHVVDVVAASKKSIAVALSVALDAAPLPPTPPYEDALGTWETERRLVEEHQR